jgi:hypothetical protein
VAGLARGRGAAIGPETVRVVEAVVVPAGASGH